MKALGMIILNNTVFSKENLLKGRPVCMMPVAGSFCCMDFSLSSMAASGISEVAVLSDFSSRSVEEHLSFSKWWDFGRKKGGLYSCPSMAADGEKRIGEGTVDMICRNLDILKNSHEPYVIIADGDMVYKQDFQEILNYHITRKADITMVCSEKRMFQSQEADLVLHQEPDGRIASCEEKEDASLSGLCFAGIVLLRRRLLLRLAVKTARKGGTDLLRDGLLPLMGTYRFYGYRTQKYWRKIVSEESYYQTNLDFLKPEIRRFFFQEMPVVRTRAQDQPPVKYLPGAVIKNSLVSGGSIVGARVENSVISGDVFLGSNSVVRNSVVSARAYVGENAHVENCIVESGMSVPANACYFGSMGKKHMNSCSVPFTEVGSEAFVSD